MPKWEYSVFKGYLSKQEADKFGAAGWEMVGFAEIHGESTYWFKRQGNATIAPGYYQEQAKTYLAKLAQKEQQEKGDK